MTRHGLLYNLVSFSSKSILKRVEIAEQFLLQFFEEEPIFDSLICSFIKEPTEDNLNKIRIFLVSTNELTGIERVSLINKLETTCVISKVDALKIISRMQSAGDSFLEKLIEESRELLEMINEGFFDESSEDVSIFFKQLSQF